MKIALVFTHESECGARENSFSGSRARLRVLVPVKSHFAELEVPQGGDPKERGLGGRCHCANTCPASDITRFHASMVFKTANHQLFRARSQVSTCCTRTQSHSLRSIAYEGPLPPIWLAPTLPFYQTHTSPLLSRRYSSHSKRPGSSHRMNLGSEPEKSALERYGVDLTAKARDGKLDPVIGREFVGSWLLC